MGLVRISKLIRLSRSLPRGSMIVGYDIRIADPRAENAVHLFNLAEESVVEEKPKHPIGF